MNDVNPQPGVALEISPGARAGLAARARGRRLVIDWFVTRCCGNVTVGDVVFRWRAAGQPIDPDAVRVGGTDGLELWIRPELVPLFARVRAGIVLRGIGPWRPGTAIRDVDLSDPAVAEDVRFPASPTIWIDGRDVDPTASSGEQRPHLDCSGPRRSMGYERR